MRISDYFNNAKENLDNSKNVDKISMSRSCASTSNPSEVTGGYIEFPGRP